jgi:uncharacterized protein (DUF362 family)
MTKHESDDQINRREFALRSLRAGAAVAATAGVACWLHDPRGPGAQPSRQNAVSLPDFSVAAQGRKMSIATGSDRAKTVAKALEAVGGIGAFIRKGDRVMLKVNAAFASPAILSATTNPEVVAEVARLCLQAGAASVVVTDNPINDAASCFALSGIEQGCKSVGASLILPRQNQFCPTTVKDGRLIANWPLLYGPFEGTNKLIGIAPLKHHERSGASMTMKNWYGLLGGRRNTFHQDINGIIKELAMMVRPTLVILDGTTAMMRNGPTGGSLEDLKQTNTMIVGADQVAVDAFGATLLGKTPADLPYIALAEAAGCGTANYELLSPVRIDAS